jgi:two-component system NtrC family sensor kinase
MDSTLALVAHLHRVRIEVVREYAAVPPVACHPGQLNQVFMNLLVNAIQAIDGQGAIRIRLAVEDRWLRVDVEDSGAGIAPEHLSRIFDPGIGVTSRPGAGSTFTVRLPLAAARSGP